LSQEVLHDLDHARAWTKPHSMRLEGLVTRVK
jgi:hypothetical protein